MLERFEAFGLIPFDTVFTRDEFPGQFFIKTDKDLAYCPMYMHYITLSEMSLVNIVDQNSNDYIKTKRLYIFLGIQELFKFINK